MFVLDIETLGTESNAIVLSAAIVYFDTNEKYEFQSLLNSCVFVKFDAKEQKTKYNRTVEQSTINWWKEQNKEAKQISLFPRNDDKTALDGINILKHYIEQNQKEKQEICWIRGTLDQVCMDSLCKDLNVPFLFPYFVYRDVRTALDMTKETCVRGYCKIKDFDSSEVNKHDPVHDVCFDALQLLYGI